MLAIRPKIVSLKTKSKIAPSAPTPDNIPQGDKFKARQIVKIEVIIIIINFNNCK